MKAKSIHSKLAYTEVTLMKSLFAKKKKCFALRGLVDKKKYKINSIWSLKECRLKKTFFEQMKRGAATFYGRAASFLELAVVW